MNNLETIIFRVGWDAKDVEKGMQKLMAERARIERVKAADHAKLVSGYRQQEKEQAESRRRIETAEQQESARRNIQARRLRRERIKERESEAKESAAAALRAEVEQARRNIQARRLWRERARRREERNEEGLSGGVMGESMVLVRELMRGNFSRVPASASILLQRLGWLGNLMKLVTNPIALGGAAAYGVANGAINRGHAATATLNQSAAAGFSAQGYQGLMMQTANRPGGNDAAQGAINHLYSNVLAAGNGSLEAYQKFKMWGVAIADVNGKLMSGEQIYRNVLDALRNMPEGLRKTAAATDLLGSNWREMEREISAGSEGFDSNRGGLSERSLKAQKYLGEGISMRGLWNSLKRLNSWSDNLVLEHEGRMGSPANLARLEMEGRALDEKRAALRRRLSSAQFDRELFKYDPALFENRLGLQHARRDANESFGDRLKSGLGGMADIARSFTGQPHRRLYGMTPRLRTALRIQDLEEQANVAFMKGDDSTYNKLNSEAAQMRAANPWLAGADKNILRNQSESLSSIDRKMSKVEEMAKLAVEGHRQ